VTICDRFLGPRMVYTSGVVLDLENAESLEQLQDNKLAVVCEKLDLQPDDCLLDVGCGWGTLVAYAAKNYGCDVTGITLGKNQTAFGNKRIKDNEVTPDQARILCMDYREIPGGPEHYTKIVSLEMAEVRQSWLRPSVMLIKARQHVGVRRYGVFLRQMYDLLDDNGIFVLQVAGIRPHWQYEDLIWLKIF
jgi:sphingolipid C9-methyltransferase